MSVRFFLLLLQYRALLDFDYYDFWLSCNLTYSSESNETFSTFMSFCNRIGAFEINFKIKVLNAFKRVEVQWLENLL
jgi:hypothetical protein